MIREKRHRLRKDFYAGYRTVAFTARLQNYCSAFVDDEIFREMESMLIEAATTHLAKAAIYLFMPDHAHFILAANDADGDVLSAMKRFKQRSSYWLVRNRPAMRWQKDFYDHILRRDDDLNRHVRYILGNPVRAGLVRDWKDYRYRGSTLYDLDSWTFL